jgi:hypothetical protein
MMRIVLAGLFLIFLSACDNQNASPTPTPTPGATYTISAEQITAAATYRRTLPPSFTPTFTPTATFTPSITPTPGMTPTATNIPEAVLCEAFVTAIVLPISTASTLLMISLNYDAMIHLRLIYVETEKVILEGDLPGNNIFQIQFKADDLPYSGEYRWELSLADETRSEVCQRSDVFQIVKPEITPELSPEMTAEATAELTAEVTEEG